MKSVLMFLLATLVLAGCYIGFTAMRKAGRKRVLQRLVRYGGPVLIAALAVFGFIVFLSINSIKVF